MKNISSSRRLQNIKKQFLKIYLKAKHPFSLPTNMAYMFFNRQSRGGSFCLLHVGVGTRGHHENTNPPL